MRTYRQWQEEQWTTTEFIDEETHCKGGEEVDDVENTVDFETKLGIGDTSSRQHIVHIVRD